MTAEEVLAEAPELVEMTVEEVLAEAADLVERHWAQGDAVAVGGPWCAGLAINRAALMLGPTLSLSDLYRIGDAAWWALAKELGVPERGVADWNDAPGRTKEEVATALRNAKRHL